MVLNPNPKLKLSAQDLKTWKYWSYGYYGSDGCDWREYQTDKGWKDIPRYAEEVTPIEPY